MPFDDGGSGNKKSVNDESQKTVEEVIEKISKRSFSKYAYKEDKLISKGKSIFDIAQDKIIEFWRRNVKPEANPGEDSEWIYRNINQGERKLYKYSDNVDSIDDEVNFNPKYLAQDRKPQDKLEKFEIIQKVFNSYNERNQLIVDLGLFKQKDDKEVARRTNTTAGNVRKIICDFKKDCRKFGIKSSESKQNKNH